MRNKKELQIILGAGLIPQKNGLIIVRLLPPPAYILISQISLILFLMAIGIIALHKIIFYRIHLLRHLFHRFSVHLKALHKIIVIKKIVLKQRIVIEHIVKRVIKTIRIVFAEIRLELLVNAVIFNMHGATVRA